MKTRWNLADAGQSMVCTVILSAVLLSNAAFADDPAPASTRDSGSWEKHQYSFVFMGFTTTYSCDGLADKLKMLLLAAGARPDAKARSGACAAGYGRPDKFARSDLTFYTLKPLAGDAPANEKPVAGIWRPVALARRSPWELAIGDCELVEQFRYSVLPMFATRNVQENTTCIPHQESGSVIDLKFESFAAPPPGAATPAVAAASHP